jgi:hypothetical protein
MNNYRKLLSVLLVLLLIFPLIYQAVHLYHGHGLRIKSHESEIISNINVEFHIEFDDCLICDFDYVVFLAGQTIHTFSRLAYAVIDLPLETIDITFQYGGFITSLRGPPAIF